MIFSHIPVLHSFILKDINGHVGDMNNLYFYFLIFAHVISTLFKITCCTCQIHLPFLLPNFSQDCWKCLNNLLPTKLHLFGFPYLQVFLSQLPTYNISLSKTKYINLTNSSTWNFSRTIFFIYIIYRSGFENFFI